MCYYGEGPEFSSERTVTARKPHKCCECGRVIEVGEQYEYVTGVWEGDFCTFKTCRHCIAVRLWLRKVCNSFAYAGLYEDIYEHKQEGYSPRWLSIAASGIRKQWKKADGSLWRPMSLPKNLPVGGVE